MEFLGCLLWKMEASPIFQGGGGTVCVGWTSCCFRAPGLRVEPQGKSTGPRVALSLKDLDLKGMCSGLPLLRRG